MPLSALPLWSTLGLHKQWKGNGNATCPPTGAHKHEIWWGLPALLTGTSTHPKSHRCLWTITVTGKGQVHHCNWPHLSPKLHLTSLDCSGLYRPATGQCWSPLVLLMAFTQALEQNGCMSPGPWWWHFNDLQNLSSWIQGETHGVGNAPREGSNAWLEHKLRFGLHLLSSLDKIAGKWHSLFEALIPCLWRKAVITTCFTWLIGIAEMSHHPGCVIYQISFSGPVTWLEAVNYRVGGGCTITVINEGLIELMLSAVPWSHLLAIQMDILGEPVHVVLLVHASLPYYQVK